mmetsp:Transcript_969/g.3845  ORF Transcript_969/g.3845 Transcript_969/m.3845 type:complete len:213 (+) Transcript_969:81-719(+)
MRSNIAPDTNQTSANSPDSSDADWKLSRYFFGHERRGRATAGEYSRVHPTAARGWMVVTVVVFIRTDAAVLGRGRPTLLSRGRRRRGRTAGRTCAAVGGAPAGARRARRRLELGTLGRAADLGREVRQAHRVEELARVDVDLDLVGDVLRDDRVERALEDLGDDAGAVDDVELADDERVLVDEDRHRLDDGGDELRHRHRPERAPAHVGDRT